ncbi:unnamed protein product [Owenia fusiformis]|uniref:Uncharacterized protein n=1 Tax=Owenia fusiformis TaxID=6347 RepID=A0A8J1TSL0_OWEFU|nr:unnamed protein product [Owenia fusiformis]
MTFHMGNSTVELPVSPTLTSISTFGLPSSLGTTTQSPLLLNPGNITHCLPLSNRTSLPLVLTAPEHLDELVLSHYTQHKVGDSIRLSCDISRELQGDGLLTCVTSTKGAHWDKVVPLCVERKIALPPPPPKFNGTVFKSSVIGGVIAVVILLAFITFFMYRLREHQRRKRMAREERDRSSTTVTVMTDCAVSPSHDAPGNMLLTTFTTVAITDNNAEANPKDVVINNLTPQSSCVIPAPAYTATVHSSRTTNKGEITGRNTGPASISVPCPVAPIQFAQGECSPPYYDTPNITSPTSDNKLDLGVESSEDKYDEPANVDTDDDIMADFKFPNTKVIVKDESEDEPTRYEIPEAQPGNAKSVVVIRSPEASPRYEAVDDELPSSPSYEILSSDVPKRSVSYPEPPSPGYEIPDVAGNRPNSFDNIPLPCYDAPSNKPIEVKKDPFGISPLETPERVSVNSKRSSDIDGIRSDSTVSLCSHYTDMSRQNSTLSFHNDNPDDTMMASTFPPPPAPETIAAIINDSLEQVQSANEDCANYVLPDPTPKPHENVTSDLYDVPPLTSSRQNSTVDQSNADMNETSAHTEHLTDDTSSEPKNEYENVQRETMDTNDAYVNTRLPLENDKLPVTTV